MSKSNQNARKHGLRAIEDRGAVALPANAPTVRTLGTLADVSSEVSKLRDSALWVAAKLGEQWNGKRSALVLSDAGRLVGLYADIAGRAEAASVEFTAGAVKPMAGELSEYEFTEAVKRSEEITTLLFQMVGIGREWLTENGVYMPESAEPRPLLRYFGEYIERARRQAMRHAALLAMGSVEDDDLSVSLARATLGSGKVKVNA